MPDFAPVPLLAADSLSPGESAEVVAAGRIFAVYNVDGQFHVLDGICPHAGGPLGKGSLSGGIVTCPWHGWQFDVRSGQHCLNQSLCQASWMPEIIDGMVCIQLSRQ
ncbi:MAG: Rieske 2Fe-2S domain-containing protein [Planctomycetaceae bacterium]